ncbi:hypothetical protein ABT104_13805 [Streptomyces mobaraensis]|uniref:hypothetical protein n=1 Tax=Streptomyces mobaraensis TaxID=35621 RepID=UPI00332A5848
MSYEEKWANFGIPRAASDLARLRLAGAGGAEGNEEVNGGADTAAARTARLLHDQPAMATSLGVMGGAYVDDLNDNVSGLGDSDHRDPEHGGLRDSDAFPAAYKGRAGFGDKGASTSSASSAGTPNPTPS